ncbi:MAG: glycosyltransferase [Lachnospiraceae bacterium]|nr:glycosyltransferase [Lachnospiraceae bacterium]MDD3616034.1 glycosyltransferase [Lachnospiraceae bacterium]
MRVYLYSGMQKLIEKSGVGRAIYHQRRALTINGIELAQSLEDADVVHINTIFPDSLKIVHKAHEKGIPVVFHAHSTKEDFRNSYLGSNLFDWLFGKWICHCYCTGDYIVTPTEYSKRLLVSYGINKKITAVSNGIDLDYYEKEKVASNAFRKKYGYGSDAKIIMSVGLTIDRKGVIDFVELAKRMPEYQFIWYGATNLNTVPLKVRKAVQTKLPNLKFAGYAKKDELREAYAGCNLFLFPSKEETEGIVVLEALAMKIPVLLRDIPVYQDWLKPNQDVYKASCLDEFEKKTRSILENRLPILVEEGYRVVKSRAIEQIGRQLGTVYENCLNNV